MTSRGFRTFAALALAGAAAFPGGRGPDPASPEQLRRAMAALRPLHAVLGRPRPGDWLTLHPEPGQTFDQYLACAPTLPRGRRRVLYVQPLGDFTPAQRRIVDRTAEYLQLAFHRPVKVLPGLPEVMVPVKARRRHPVEGQLQFLTSFLRDGLLKPRLPEDGAVLLGLTATDLWPGKGWNFVFGEAALQDRVGVWSLARNGDPARSPEAFRLCLLRTIKTAGHETAHMFSFQHCTRYECTMAGSETQAEADRYPLAFCPECLAKLCWATETPPADHLRRMADFCARNGLKDEEAYYRRALGALKARP
jgi:archaemetzincin